METTARLKSPGYSFTMEENITVVSVVISLSAADYAAGCDKKMLKQLFTKQFFDWLL